MGGNDDGQDFDMLMGMITDLNEQFTSLNEQFTDLNEEFDELSCAVPIVDFFFRNDVATNLITFG